MPVRTYRYAKKSTKSRKKTPAQSKKANSSYAKKSRATRPYTYASDNKYSGTAANVGGMLGSAVGTYLAPGIGTSIGGMLGRGAGDLISKITGFGDYKVTTNSILFPDQADQIPSFGKNITRIKHREYIADISSSSSFNVDSYYINPGLVSSFPWLSAVAQQYEMYCFNGLVYEFVSTSADALNSTNTALGKIIMATDYDALDANFVSIQQMMGSEFSCMGKPSESLLHAIECAPNESPLRLNYVRSGEPAANADIRLYDLGKFNIATQGSQATANIGSLWVSYDITFCKPIMNNSVGINLLADHYNLTAPSQSGSAWLGTSRSLDSGSNLGTSITNSNVCSWPENMSTGTFLFVYTAYGSSTALSNPSIAFTNATILGIWQNGTASVIENGSSTTTKYIYVAAVRIDNAGAYVTFSGGTLPTSPTYGDLMISQMNANFL